MGISKVTGGAVLPPTPRAAPPPPPAPSQPSAVDEFVKHGQASLQARVDLDEPKTFGDLDLATQRAARDQLKALLPPSTPAYRAVVTLVTSDAFAKLTPAAQQAVLRAVASITTSAWFATWPPAAQKSIADPVLATRLGAVLGNKAFGALDVKTQAKVASALVNPLLADADRAELVAVLSRPALAKLDPQVKNALVGALAKSPGDTELQSTLLAVTTSSTFRKLPAEAQVGFLHAVEHQTDVILLEGEQTNQAALLTLVGSPEFRRLDPGAQTRWLTALGSDTEAVRGRATERLQDTLNGWANGRDALPERTDWLRRRSTALDRPDQTTNLRASLPGAAKTAPVVTRSSQTAAAVFFNENLKGINPTPQPVDAYHVTIDGQTIDVFLAKPLPAGSPTVEGIASALAKLPAAARSHVRQVIVDPKLKNVLQAISAKGERPNRVFMGPQAPPPGPELLGFLSHESGHLVAADVWGEDPKARARWEAAIASDPHAVSDYATASLQEDVAETIQRYYQVKGTPAEAQLQRDMPARYAAVKALLGD